VTRPGRSRRGGLAVAGRQVEDRRLDADRTATAVEDQSHGVAEFGAHVRASVGLMRPKRLADGAATPHRPPTPAAGLGKGPQQRQRQRVRRHAQTDRLLAAGDDAWVPPGAPEDQRQRPGPEGFGQFPGQWPGMSRAQWSR
jgi:hypothetical protein